MRDAEDMKNRGRQKSGGEKGDLICFRFDLSWGGLQCTDRVGVDTDGGCLSPPRSFLSLIQPKRPMSFSPKILLVAANAWPYLILVCHLCNLTIVLISGEVVVNTGEVLHSASSPQTGGGISMPCTYIAVQYLCEVAVIDT